MTAHERAMLVFDRAMHEVIPASMTAPTPCTEWSVRDLISHLVYEQRWVPELIAGGTIDEVGDRFDGDQLGDDPLGAWVESSRAAHEALRQPGALNWTVNLSYGEESAREYGWQLTTDLAVHGWDLARAIGLEKPGTVEIIGDELAADLLAHAEPMANAWQGSGIFAPPVPVDPDANAQTRLIALLGRQP